MKKLLTILMGLIFSGLVFAGGLITPSELNKIKDNDDVIIIDYRWDKVPEKTIPGAMVVLNKDVSRNVEGTNGMVLPKAEFENLMSGLGIDNNDTIVIVDDSGMMNASRLWWILKLYGHEGDVFIVDGQIMAWEKAGLEMATPSKVSKRTNYVAKDANKDLVVDLADIKETINNNKMVVIDTRSKLERMAGHVPNSVYIEWKNNITPEGTYKSKEELQKIYTDAGVTKDLEVVAPHCKSAVRSTQTMFALVEILGYDNVKNYDGSWLEYGSSDAPKELGM